MICNEYYLYEPEKLKGKHIIAFEVDFDLIKNCIENAMKHINSKNNDKNGIYLPANDDVINEYTNIIRNNKKNIVISDEPSILINGKRNSTRKIHLDYENKKDDDK
ncbi:hypothetical protein [Picrophilus oshimae]|uniref:Uncharacterized protein n=1 Tax=Picrophilus torridus (strain ATCC 700027 / DSM 9790 / JCM 10055 / NBRC 100828 / KAW 2/3) TaxID=1122961 RepID=A0A8G2FWM4_PICTO|nr:hypothetical protein [Picrophilus oshimae]SMD30819.1 hypothetical protein SAMN02745355_0732 [Picrophilus oshimae DSM 9789]